MLWLYKIILMMIRISNSSKIIGALVQSDKPVVVNSGSFGGSNST